MDISRRQFLFAAAAALAFPADALAEDKKTKRKKKRKNKYATTDPSRDPDDILLARMLYGETRASYITDAERRAVGFVAINRRDDPEDRWGSTLREVILSPRQYSCFNPDDPNRPIVLNPEADNPQVFYHLLELARTILNGKCKDPVHANHYHERTLERPDWPDRYRLVSGKDVKDGLLVVGKTKKGNPIYSRHKFYTG
jgi:hypothetical protein